MHIELHYCPTARDAARLQHGGLPRYDIEPTKCGACMARVGEVENRDGTVVAWKPFAVVVSETVIDVVCGKCLKPVDKVLAA